MKGKFNNIAQEKKQEDRSRTSTKMKSGKVGAKYMIPNKLIKACLFINREETV
jgi:hypothetical protein